jgi:putative ABC transport system permease protein
VEAVGLVSNLPLTGNYDRSGLHVEEKPLANPSDAPSPERYGISPDYLRAMRIPLLSGRGFTERDSPEAPRVALISETLARRVWPNADPLGKRIRLGGAEDPLLTIVGIVGDVRHLGLDDAPQMQAYVPHAQWTTSFVQLVVRTTTDPAAAASSVRREVWAVDKDQPVYDVATMQERVSKSVARSRFTVLLLGIFAAVAMVMAAVGIYGVISYSVTQRTQELGIRVALGAQRGDILRLVVGQGLALTLLGVGVGLAASFALTRWLERLLFEVSATDPVTFALIAVLLTLVALLACYLPARRATQVDPLVALRYE